MRSDQAPRHPHRAIVPISIGGIAPEERRRLALARVGAVLERIRQRVERERQVAQERGAEGDAK